MRKYFAQARAHPVFPHVVVPLMGRFKGETGELFHLMVMAYDTQSGIPCGTWVEQLLQVTEAQRRMGGGYAFVEKNGRPSKCGDFEGEFIDRLVEVRDSRPDLFEVGVNI